MQHSTGKPTKAQEARFRKLYELGCICCILEGLPRSEAMIHHLVEGMKRLGHDFTIPVCPWHHVGQPPAGLSIRQAALMMGPSLELSKRKFVATYGTEHELLAMVNQRIGDAGSRD